MNASSVLFALASAALTVAQAPAAWSHGAPAQRSQTPGHRDAAPPESEALSFFRKECDSSDDDHYSCLMVAGMYERGEGAPKDPNRAAVYYKKAAEILTKSCARGETVACEQIKHACAQGEPVCEQIKALRPPSPVQASGPSDRSARSGSAPVSLLSGTAFLDVVDALRQRVGGATRITELDLTPSWVYLKAEDPQHPGKVDEYQWKDGSIRDPRPVDLTRVKLKDALFALDDVDLRAIPALLDESLKRVNAPGAKVSRVLADRDFSKEVQIRVIIDIANVSGGRVVTADRSGRILKIQ